MRVVDTSTMDWKHYRHPREGTLEVKTLARGTAGRVNYNFTLTRYGAAGEDPFETPRHKHTFEQFRMPIDGALNYGPGMDIPEGSIAYFPAEAAYGPQHVERCTVLLLQFGEEYLTSSQYLAAHDELAARGTFEGGIYIDTNPDTGAVRRQDAVTAVFEHALGHTLSHHRPRYREPIVMDPEAFEWQPSPDNPGLDVKALGTFTEQDTAVAMVRWAGRGTLGLEPGRTQLVVSLTDGITVDDVAYPALTAVCSTDDDETAIGGDADTRALMVTLPRG